MLTHRYAAIESDFRVASDALQESKKVIQQLESTLYQTEQSNTDLKARLAKEVGNNKQLLKELAKANQTIGKLKTHLEKQTKTVVDQAKVAK